MNVANIVVTGRAKPMRMIDKYKVKQKPLTCFSFAEE